MKRWTALALARRWRLAGSRPSGSPCAVSSSADPASARSAFTIVELVVVVTVILVVLAIALPGLSAFNVESRFSSAAAAINSSLVRAYSTALSDNSLTAIRFVPDRWDNALTAEAQRPTGRQLLVTYTYVGTAENPDNPLVPAFDEYFQRRAGAPVVTLPEDVWVAPAEALETRERIVGSYVFANLGRDLVLDGELARFALDAGGRSEASGDPNASLFLNADDFLIVFDPRAGLQNVIRPMPLKAYVPADAGYWPANTEAFKDRNGNKYRRYNFSGLVLYSRKGFVSLGAQASGAERQTFLKQYGRPYAIHRFGGGLVMGSSDVSR
jgi:type II secretory pathway pseudopilin PulG